MILFSLPIAATPTVEVRTSSEGSVLIRNGQPYFARGVGGSGSLDGIVAAGGNSIRTWGADHAGAQLDEAQKRGLTYTMGIWLGHKSYFDYGNAAKVKKQLDSVRATILKHRDHPALLMWALGNEMEEGGNDTPALWQAIDDLHKMAHEVDPNHPAMTIVADVTQEKIDLIKRYAPSLQVLGINSYGGATTLPQRLKQYGWTKPYVVTEFGPRGSWESKKTTWGAPYEANSSEKAAQYRASYLAAVEGNRSQCLGSYAFLWGDKQEATPTWYAMLLPTGEETEAVDEMSDLWTGRYPVNRALAVVSFAFDAEGKETASGASGHAEIHAKDPDGDSLVYDWELRREISKTGYAGESEKKPGLVPSVVYALKAPTVDFMLPSEPGAYRLYVTVRDPKGHAATANAPFAIKG